MNNAILQASARPVTRISLPWARLAGVAALTVLALLALLHLLSPEFDPVSRMVSEYATGQYSWVLSLMFMAWAISSWALAFALRGQLTTHAGKIGWWFLIITGVGQAMAAFFDVNHPLHGVAGLLGMPGLPIAAMLISVRLSRAPAWRGNKQVLLWIANLTWVILLLLSGAIAVMMAGLAQTGGQLTPDVIAVVGIPNRFLFVIYCGWVLTVVEQAIRMRAELAPVANENANPGGSSR